MDTFTEPTALPSPVEGDSASIDGEAHGRIEVYARGAGGDDAGHPLLLIHSVNAAASAYEVKPLFDHYAAARPTYAMDLPGYGRSDRSERAYDPRLMTDAVRAVVAWIRSRHAEAPVDAIALSLGCEFLARAATEDASAYRALAFVSPTALDGRRRLGEPGSTRGNPTVRRIVTCRLWDDALFRNLTRPRVIRYFLERTWGSEDIDEGLWAYDVETTRVRGAKHAPLSFLSGDLFSADATRLYEGLAHPVWVGHGVRGDFTRYDGVERLVAERGWRREIFDTGALPHFEVPDELFDSYDRFLASLD